MSTPETVVHPAELLQAWIAQGILLPRLQDASAQVNLRAARGIAVAAAGMLEVALVDETHTMVHCVEPHLLSLNYPHLGVDQGESAMVVLHNPHKPCACQLETDHSVYGENGLLRLQYVTLEVCRDPNPLTLMGRRVQLCIAITPHGAPADSAYYDVVSFWPDANMSVRSFQPSYVEGAPLRDALGLWHYGTTTRVHHKPRPTCDVTFGYPGATAFMRSAPEMLGEYFAELAEHLSAEHNTTRL